MEALLKISEPGCEIKKNSSCLNFQYMHFFIFLFFTVRIKQTYYLSSL